MLPKYATLTQHSIQQGALEAVIVTERAGPVRLYSLHLSHLSTATRMPQVEALLDIHARAPSEGGAWCGGHPDPAAGWTEGEMPPMPAEALLMGDFNFDWCAPEYDRIVGPRSDRYGRLNRVTGFVDAWVAAGQREDEGATIGSGRRIDYCFVSSALASRSDRAASIPTPSAPTINRSGSTWICEATRRYLTDPSVSPRTMKRWPRAISSNAGIVEITAAAAI
jgi:endonuclease/exonuclease/phosphatase family metal-dependent hydrolase